MLSGLRSSVHFLRRCPSHGGHAPWLRCNAFARCSRSLVIALIFLGSTAIARDEGMMTDRESQPDPEPATLAELRSFVDTLSLIRNNYVDAIPDAELLDAATRGLVDRLDDPSAYLGPEAFRSQDETNQGRRVGIGARVGIVDQRLVVQAVYPQGPAWLAGVQDGDIIQAIDGERVRGRRLQASLNALAGEEGTPVSLRLRTPGMAAREISLQRAYVPIPSVQAEWLPGDVAKLTIDRFTLGTRDEFEKELTRLRTTSDAELTGVIIDLRNNLGGVVRTAAEIADGFLDEGKVVYTRGRYRESRLEYDAVPGQWTPGLPVAVLVNGASASAAEILAGALQDHGRAAVVGSRSYGKGTVQSVFRLRNGSALRLTTARYYMPSGRSFDGQGIEPDIAIKPGPEAHGTQVELSDDRTLQAALAAIQDGRIAVD